MRGSCFPLVVVVVACWLATSVCAFVPEASKTIRMPTTSTTTTSTTVLRVNGDNNNNNNNNNSNNNQQSSNDAQLDQKTFGGYTVRQRLREEVESPFRTVRLWFFGASTGSALVALYFSIFNAVRANAGPTVYPDAQTMDEALQSVGINIGAVVICGLLTLRDWRAGEANLKRIAKGGALAKLVVAEQTAKDDKQQSNVVLADYRRKARVLLAAGGTEYIQALCRRLNADQQQDTNTIPQALAASDVMVVPILLEPDGNSGIRVGDTQACWSAVQVAAADDDDHRNFDLARSQQVVAIPRGTRPWTEYLESDIATATSQGFDVLEKGFIIVVKKNGRILRRATGQPPFDELLGTMEVLDGSKFGMPGDSEKYET